MTPWMVEAGDAFKRLFQGAVAGALVMVMSDSLWVDGMLEALRKSEPDRPLLPLFHRPVSTSPTPPGTRNRDSSNSPSMGAWAGSRGGGALCNHPSRAIGA
jgi:hypothetical protein